MELVCPAGGLPALKSAIDNGADWVYAGLRDDTNARNFPGLNFDSGTLASGLAYAHARGRKVVVAINTYPQPANWGRWTAAVDRAAGLRAKLDDFLALALRREDPDSLFFTRRLVVEGDTETGLALKNALDALG